MVVVGIFKAELLKAGAHAKNGAPETRVHKNLDPKILQTGVFL
jgi:hypothetical protein